jgi:hypothetical protein
MNNIAKAAEFWERPRRELRNAQKLRSRRSSLQGRGVTSKLSWHQSRNASLIDNEASHEADHRLIIVFIGVVGQTLT